LSLGTGAGAGLSVRGEQRAHPDVFGGDPRASDDHRHLPRKRGDGDDAQSVVCVFVVEPHKHPFCQGVEPHRARDY